jgi:hypothetical protein
VKSKTGNANVDATMLGAESVRQQSVSVATTQAQLNTAQVVFERAVLASKITNGLDPGNELIALRNLGATV